MYDIWICTNIYILDLVDLERLSAMNLQQVHVSKMTGKLIEFDAISTNTTSNNFCQKMFKAKKETICKKCYSWQMLMTYRKNMVDCLERNSVLLSSSVLHTQQLPTIMKLYFRFSAHGELINLNHAINLFNICDKNELTTFALWTKRKDLIKKILQTRNKPKNLILVYSNPIMSNIMYEPPENFDKVFNNVLEHENVEEQNCTGQKCKDCLACYKFGGTDIIVEKVKKY